MNSDFNQNLSSCVLTTQNIEKAIMKKCTKHPQEIGEFIHLKPHSSHSCRLCFSCIQEEEIPIKDVIQIRQLLNATSENYLPTYPVLSDPSIIKNIKAMIGSVDTIMDQCDKFFIDLKEQFLNSLEKAKNKQKATLIQLSEAYQKTLDAYKKVSQLPYFQQLVISNEINAETKLQGFITEIFLSQEDNSRRINNCYSEFEQLKKQFQPDKHEDILKFIIDYTESIDLFLDPLTSLPKTTRSKPTLSKTTRQPRGTTLESPSLPETSIISSFLIEPSIVFANYKEGYLKIQKNEDKEIILTNMKPRGKGVQCYTKNILDQNLNYIIRVNIINQNLTDEPKFSIGLLTKFYLNEYVSKSNLAWEENSCNSINNYWKIISGKQINKSEMSQQLLGKQKERKLEFRINLMKQYFAVASYPDYENIQAFTDLDRFKDYKGLSEQFYFAIYIGLPQDQVLIKSVCTVEKFDDKFEKKNI